MSSRSFVNSECQPVYIDSGHTHLALAPEAVNFRKNGIEFKSPVPLAQWMEMTVEMEAPTGGRPVKCCGIVVACNGSRHAGFSVSLMFTGMTRNDQAQLSQIAYSVLA